MRAVCEWFCLGLSIFFLGVLLFAYVGGFVANILAKREENRIRQQLERAGRFLYWEEIEPKFSTGDGTLIFEHCSPKGPLRVWWTQDDILATSPIPLPTVIPKPDKEVDSHTQYSKEIAARYLDLESGSAKGTKVPGDVWKKKLTWAEKYPQGKMVTLQVWWGIPLLYLGAVDTLFRDEVEPDPPPLPK